MLLSLSSELALLKHNIDDHGDAGVDDGDRGGDGDRDSGGDVGDGDVGGQDHWDTDAADNGHFRHVDG